jgi:hypothetical protein
MSDRPCQASRGHSTTLTSLSKLPLSCNEIAGHGEWRQHGGNEADDE